MPCASEAFLMIHGAWMKLTSGPKLGGNIYTVPLIVLAIGLTLCSAHWRDKPAAKRFFGKAFKPTGSQLPRLINVDKNTAYPPSIEELKAESTRTQACELRQNKYLNNLVEQHQRFIKQLVNRGLGFQSFYTPIRTIIGAQIMNSIRKGRSSSNRNR